MGQINCIATILEFWFLSASFFCFIGTREEKGFLEVTSHNGPIITLTRGITSKVSFYFAN